MRFSAFGPSCWIVCLISAGALAQLTQPGPSLSYEGQNVSAVALIANPHRDLKPLVALVTQKAGEPYSENKIEASRQALQRAGQFPKVQVSIVPEVNGLRVNFLLEPAYYLGIVQFPGAEKLFTYTRLLQIADLPDEDPYDPARVPIAEKALTDFLHHNGYFQASVQAEPAIDDAHQLVSVKFAIEMGKQAKISSVQIDGPTGPENNRLLHAVHSLRARLSGGLLKKGKAYTPERLSS